MSDGGVPTMDMTKRLSRDLKHCILERMTADDAARTSILSKNWRYVWSEHPQIVLDKPFFEEQVAKRKTSNFAYALVPIVSQIFKQRMSNPSFPIQKFILYIPDLKINWVPYINQWISFLSNCGIKELSLDNGSINSLEVSCVFSCQELIELEFRNCIFIPSRLLLPVLPNLVRIYLEKVAFGPFTINTPLLVSLELVHCSGFDNFKINAPKLGFCSIAVNSHDDLYQLSFGRFSVVFPSPKLTELNLPRGTSWRIAKAVSPDVRVFHFEKIAFDKFGFGHDTFTIYTPSLVNLNFVDCSVFEKCKIHAAEHKRCSVVVKPL